MLHVDIPDLLKRQVYRQYMLWDACAINPEYVTSYFVSSDYSEAFIGVEIKYTYVNPLDITRNDMTFKALIGVLPNGTLELWVN